jgi:hypothetical protein
LLGDKKEEMKMLNTRTELKLLITVGLLILFTGCAENIRFVSPEPYQYEFKVPLKAVLYVEKIKKDVLINYKIAPWATKTIPIGEIVYEYAKYYMQDGFASFYELTIPNPAPPRGMF